MSLEYIRQYYGVPAELGRRVRVSYGKDNPPREGVIVGATNQYIELHLDGDKRPRGVYHPTSDLTYLGMGTVPKLTRSQERYRRYRRADCFDSFRQFLAYEKDEKEATRLGFADVGKYWDWRRTI